ncbi:MAG: hypothetical protein A2Y40_01510 [Candidatus Margulisbacteria bacterium GWF2_35_9]|nr:MAG: hypothetical protein A2Y40_01510 [Candidatus Margulisbacteria bacterium GWF2_35_9]
MIHIKKRKKINKDIMKRIILISIMFSVFSCLSADDPRYGLSASNHGIGLSFQLSEFGLYYEFHDSKSDNNHSDLHRAGLRIYQNNCNNGTYINTSFILYRELDPYGSPKDQSIGLYGGLGYIIIAVR